MSRPRARAAAGFTLIEMVAAIAVVAIALGAIIAGMARYTENAGYLRTRTIALWVAHNRLTELAIDRKWPDVGESNGESEMAGVTWKWKATIKATDDAHLRRVDVEVSAPKAKTPSARLSGFLADAGRQ